MTRVLIVRVLTELTLFLLHILNARILMASLNFFANNWNICRCLVWIKIHSLLEELFASGQSWDILKNLVAVFLFSCWRQLDTNLTQRNNTHYQFFNTNSNCVLQEASQRPYLRGFILKFCTPSRHTHKCNLVYAHVESAVLLGPVKLANAEQH
jgi:hypothetical protein